MSEWSKWQVVAAGLDNPMAVRVGESEVLRLAVADRNCGRFDMVCKTDQGLRVFTGEPSLPLRFPIVEGTVLAAVYIPPRVTRIGWQHIVQKWPFKEDE